MHESDILKCAALRISVPLLNFLHLWNLNTSYAHRDIICIAASLFVHTIYIWHLLADDSISSDYVVLVICSNVGLMFLFGPI